ncbi:hypothetical protein EVAR_26661_1 [Eumeta japonica]|uniref:Uncharacterized protein n=1 Tax=Eumeta variegata TaxID=151549 RepID=A0A4C1VN49_EUMVA|nr:hypothetical protein EVAR_26661_1 [Eumeta japonica]
MSGGQKWMQLYKEKECTGIFFFTLKTVAIMTVQPASADLSDCGGAPGPYVNARKCACRRTLRHRQKQ